MASSACGSEVTTTSRSPRTRAGRGAKAKAAERSSSTSGQSCRKASSAGSSHWKQERSEEHTSELQSLMRISYAVFCLKKKKQNNTYNTNTLYPNQTKNTHIKKNKQIYTKQN